MFEIGLHSYCNRNCGWCPNSKFERSTYKELDEGIFKKLISDLLLADYNRYIGIGRYSEPMFNNNLLRDRCEYIKKHLNVTIVVNTNGDYLTRRNIEDLRVDHLAIMDYDCIGLDKCINKLKSSDIEIQKISYPFVYGRTKTIESVLYYIDWPKNKLLRSKIDKRFKRIQKCLDPVRYLGVEVNGDVIACCDMRNDNPDCKDYIFGNLYKESILDIIKKSKYLEFVSIMKDGLVLKYPDICKYCEKGPSRYTGDDPGYIYK